MSGTGPDPGSTDWSGLAEAVAAAAYRVEDQAADGFDTGMDASARAAGVIDAAIEAVEQRRRLRHNAAADVALDRAVFDGQTLKDLVEFLRHARQGLLTRQELVQEAGMWQQLLPHGWPSEARDAPTITRAVELLCALPNAEGEPTPLTPVGPVNELERVMTEVRQDESAKPKLWRALFDGEIVLPVVAFDLIRPEGANFQLLTAPIKESPLVFGFATEGRFDALLPEGSQVSRVTPLGRDLPRFWPDGHWLMINPCYDNQVVLSPWEIKGLPHGGRSELPHPRATRIEPPGEDDARHTVLVDVVAALPQVDHVVWARVRPSRGAGRTIPWQDLLVVAATDSDDEAAAINALSAALPNELFPRAAVVARQPDLAHPFIEAAVEAGRCVGASGSS